MTSMEQSGHTEELDVAVSNCYWHADAQTRISCSRCSKPICPQCMVQASVGIRCRECGQATKMPTYDVGRAYYARAIGVAVGVAIGGGVLWGIVNSFFGMIPFLPSLIAIGLGYGSGELIGLSVNRKRATGLAWIAGGSVVLAFFISWVIQPFGFGMWGLVLIILGVVVAVQRVRR